QAMMEYAAKNFPDVFKGYKLKVKESHQDGKADTSGTAKAVVGYFNELGIPFYPEQIIMVRKPIEQIELGVPEEYLGGHGWHKYTFVSEDETVLFEFTHNINGRDIYAAGTIDAIRYLDKKVAEGAEGKIYSMIDVLEGK
ncbi:MAG: dihydrodipicolinate reductase, partial [Candidatus Aenigmarchaeota archaeon]|nr:dihydrodipicolinate reductase [Candidatus Aenigmarchaeota archaeon]